MLPIIFVMFRYAGLAQQQHRPTISYYSLASLYVGGAIHLIAVPMSSLVLGLLFSNLLFRQSVTLRGSVTGMGYLGNTNN